MIELCSITGTTIELTQSIGYGLMSVIHGTALSHCDWMTSTSGVLPAPTSRLADALVSLIEERTALILKS